MGSFGFKDIKFAVKGIRHMQVAKPYRIGFYKHPEQQKEEHSGHPCLSTHPPLQHPEQPLPTEQFQYMCCLRKFFPFAFFRACLQVVTPSTLPREGKPEKMTIKDVYDQGYTA